MKLRYVGLAEFVPDLPGDKQRVENGDVVEVNERLANKLLKTARWEKDGPKPRRRPAPRKPVITAPVEPEAEVKGDESD